MLRAAASRWKDRKDRAITEMKGEPRAWGNAASALLPVATAAVAAGIFIVDSLTPPDVVVTVLYVAVSLGDGRRAFSGAHWPR
jgi:hypothetical protein